MYAGRIFGLRLLDPMCNGVNKFKECCNRYQVLQNYEEEQEEEVTKALNTVLIEIKQRAVVIKKKEERT